ncbi:MAG: hypothetical protein ACLQDQ_17215 [Myxococcaceae bacterium]
MKQPLTAAPRVGLVVSLLAALAVSVASGCLGEAGPSALDVTADSGSVGGASGTGGGKSDGGAVILSTDLPCDVYSMLSTSCWACHGPTPAGGAPQSLVTPAELAAASPGYPSQSNGVRMLTRMASSTAPMPPAGSGYPAPSAAQQAAFASYVDAGFPAAECVSDGGTAPYDAGTPDAGRGSDAGSGGGGGGDGGVVVDVPCDIYSLLSTYCWACHGPTPAGGAPQSLVTLAQLQGPSPGYPGQSNGQRAVVRMADTGAPMPPAGNAAPSTAGQATFATWVDAGMPSGSCTTDGGLPDAGPPDPLNDPAQCTSGQTYTGSEGATMRPGEACIACHQTHGGPNFNVGGTVYPTGHEPDDCVASASAGAVVTVTDSTGATASFTANSNGNFSGNASLSFPITAVVSFNGKTRAMTTAVASGDCNSCHTQTGTNGAPGRVTLPPP